VWKRKRRECPDCTREKRRERLEGKSGIVEEKGLLGDDDISTGRGDQRIARDI